MLAVVYDAVGATPRLTEVPAPSCPADGVVVQVRATGVCRSDWHAWRGHDPVALPHIPGHELAGVILETGPLVRRFAVGERVTAPFVNGCGHCAVCDAGDPQVCPEQTQPGFTGPGSFAERVALHAADLNLVRLPDDLDFPAAAALGCRFATAYRGLTAHARLRPGEWLTVFGCGGVGLSAVAIGHALGARAVAVDVSPAALDRATELGADRTVLASPPVRGEDRIDDLAERVREATGGGAHVSVDALGSPATARAGVSSLRRRGRHVQIGLLLGADAAAALPLDRVIAYELAVFGSHGMAARHYPAMLELVSSGAVRLDGLIGAVISLAEAPAALMAMDAPAAAAGLTVVAMP